MFVRLALESDFDAICELARLDIEETRPDLGFNPEILRETIDRYLRTANPTFFVAEDARQVVGMLVAGVGRYDASDGHYTTQRVLFVRPDKRGTRASVLLMKQLIAWSEKIGASEILGGNDNEFQSDRTARFLEHFGFKRVGFAMRRTLSHGLRQQE